jgi:hypothetical protein
MAVLLSSHANVAELVDALDLGSSGVTRESSSLSLRKDLLAGPSSGAGYTRSYKKLLYEFN